MSAGRPLSQGVCPPLAPMNNNKKDKKMSSTKIWLFCLQCFKSYVFLMKNSSTIYHTCNIIFSFFTTLSATHIKKKKLFTDWAESGTEAGRKLVATGLGKHVFRKIKGSKAKILKNEICLLFYFLFIVSVILESIPRMTLRQKDRKTERQKG
jgi:hypothetical protein